MSEYIIELDSKRSIALMLALAEEARGGDAIRGEIVRCRDCKHFTPKGTHKFENGKVNEDYCDYVRGWMLQITPDGFCAWGVRKEVCNDNQ